MRKPFKKGRKIKKKAVIIIAVLLVLIIALCGFFAVKAKKNDKNEEKKYTTAYAAVGDITETISQSGVVEPYERREITSLVKGEIIASQYEEGDYVEEGATLYRIDDEDAQLQIEKAQNNIEKANIDMQSTNKDIAALSIYAPSDGILSDFKLEEGNDAPGGTIGYITNTDVLTADVPFTSYDFDKINVGDSVTVTSALYMTSLEGKVSHKFDSVVSASVDGASVKNVEIQISNPGALAVGTTVAAVCHTNAGDINSSGSGAVKYQGKVAVNNEVQGSAVSAVHVKNGDKVKKGQLIATLSNDSLLSTKKSKELSLRDSQLNLESNRKSLENYNITAPISGTVITKNSKLGDKIDNSNSSTVMMVIADMSKMKFTITVDELDIAKIQIGQTALITADAIENHTFEGRVTNVASEGTSSGDGVTVYSVEIVIDEPGALKSGMNVNADIVINEAKNAIYIPEEALMMANGNSAMVLVKSEGRTTQMVKSEKTEGSAGEFGSEPKQRGEKSKDISEGTPSLKGERTDKKPEGVPAQKDGAEQGVRENEDKGKRPGGMNLPEGYELVRITTGVSDGTNVEIKSGLSEGDEIIYIASTASASTNFNMRMPGMGGGMPRMQGGMSGGMNRMQGGMSGGQRNMSGGMRR